VLRPILSPSDLDTGEALPLGDVAVWLDHDDLAMGFTDLQPTTTIDLMWQLLYEKMKRPEDRSLGEFCYIFFLMKARVASVAHRLLRCFLFSLLELSRRTPLKGTAAKSDPLSSDVAVAVVVVRVMGLTTPEPAEARRGLQEVLLGSLRVVCGVADDGGSMRWTPLREVPLARAAEAIKLALGGDPRKELHFFEMKTRLLKKEPDLAQTGTVRWVPLPWLVANICDVWEQAQAAADDVVEDICAVEAKSAWYYSLDDFASAVSSCGVQVDDFTMAGAFAKALRRARSDWQVSFRCMLSVARNLLREGPIVASAPSSAAQLPGWPLGWTPSPTLPQELRRVLVAGIRRWIDTEFNLDYWVEDTDSDSDDSVDSTAPRGVAHNAGKHIRNRLGRIGDMGNAAAWQMLTAVGGELSRIRNDQPYGALQRPNQGEADNHRPMDAALSLRAGLASFVHSVLASEGAFPGLVESLESIMEELQDELDSVFGVLKVEPEGDIFDI